MLLQYHFDTIRKQETKSLKREEEDFVLKSSLFFRCEG